VPQKHKPRVAANTGEMPLTPMSHRLSRHGLDNVLEKITRHPWCHRFLADLVFPSASEGSGGMVKDMNIPPRRKWCPWVSSCSAGHRRAGISPWPNIVTTKMPKLDWRRKAKKKATVLSTNRREERNIDTGDGRWLPLAPPGSPLPSSLPSTPPRWRETAAAKRHLVPSAMASMWARVGVTR
jgi:hypothetical protein